MYLLQKQPQSRLLVRPNFILRHFLLRSRSFVSEMCRRFQLSQKQFTLTYQSEQISLYTAYSRSSVPMRRSSAAACHSRLYKITPCARNYTPLRCIYAVSSCCKLAQQNPESLSHMLPDIYFPTAQVFPWMDGMGNTTPAHCRIKHGRPTKECYAR